jgi:hypothetical protein
VSFAFIAYFCKLEIIRPNGEIGKVCERRQCMGQSIICWLVSSDDKPENRTLVE